MASEQIGILSIISLLALSAVILYKNNFVAFRKRLPLWAIFGICVFIAGWLCLYLSPGHTNRAKLVAEFMPLGDFLALDLAAKLKRIYLTINNFHSIMFSIFSTLSYIIFVKENFNKQSLPVKAFLYALSITLALVLAKHFYLANFIVIFCFFTFKARSYHFYRILLVLLALFMLCAFSTIQIPYLPPRARLGDNLIVLAMILLLVWKYFNENIFLHYVFYTICSLYCIYIVFAYYEYREK